MKNFLIIMFFVTIDCFGQNKSSFNQEDLANIIFDNSLNSLSYSSFDIYKEDTILFLHAKIDTVKHHLKELVYHFNNDKSLFLSIKYLTSYKKNTSEKIKIIQNPYVMDIEFYNLAGIISIKKNYKEGLITSIEFNFFNTFDKILFEYKEKYVIGFTFYRENKKIRYSLVWN